MKVEIKSQDEHSAVIAGYGIVFGGKDLEGDTFTDSTDLMLSMVPAKSVFYEHTQDIPQHALGTVIKEKPDEVGLWIEAQLDKSKAYVGAVLELIEEGVIGLSSGSIGHLVRREGKNITQWPVVEFSLTPQPAEPRTLGVEQIKKLFTEAGLTVPDAFSEVPTDEGGAEEPDSESKSTEREIEMSDEDKVEVVHLEPEPTNVEDIAAKVRAHFEAEEAAKAARQAEIDEAVSKALDEERNRVPAWKGGFSVPKITDLGTDDEGMKAFRWWIRTGDDVPYKAALQGQTDAEGGYAVPDGFYNQIVAKRDEASAARLLGATSIQTDLDVVNVPIENTSVTKFVTTSEESAADEEEPTLDQRAITIHNASKLMKVSMQLLADEKANLDGFLSDSFARAAAMWENFYFVSDGTGTGGPNSAVNRAGTGVTAADTNSITAAEVIELIHSLDSPYHSGPVGFSMLNATLGTIRRLTSTDFAFAPMPNRGDNRFMLELAGYPVAPVADHAGLTTGAKPIIFANWSYYFIAERAGMTVKRLDELYAANFQVGLLANFRLGGDSVNDEAFKVLVMA